MSSVTWKRAWYPVTGEYIDVHKALRVRDRNSGEYRENPCYHDRFSYENGCGIGLFPRKQGKDGTVAHFARYSDKENEKAARNLSDSMGMPSTAIYLNNALRVSTMIRNIGIELTKNLNEVMNVESYENKQTKKDSDCERLFFTKKYGWDLRVNCVGLGDWCFSKWGQEYSVS